jgi:hypothetical protein
VEFGFFFQAIVMHFSLPPIILARDPNAAKLFKNLNEIHIEAAVRPADVVRNVHNMVREGNLELFQAGFEFCSDLAN